MSDDVSKSVTKSWFCVFNNPHDHGYSGTPETVCERICDEWMQDHPAGSCAAVYCVSAKGLKHVHAVLEDPKAMRFSAVKKVFPSMHIQPTKGNKEQAEGYIKKTGKWSEEGEEIVYTAQRGDIKGAQGQRRDLGVIQDLIDQGMTPDQIMDMNINWRRFDKMIRDAYFSKRVKETPFLRQVEVIWHVGDSGSGKTYSVMELIEKVGEENVYFISDYEHPFDKYNGQRILFMDEFRGQIRFSTLLAILQGYRAQISARYNNIFALWEEVHISTILPPELVYKKLVSKEDEKDDTIKQLYRRISKIIYHWVSGGTFNRFEQSMEAYTSYDFLKQAALSDKDGFMKVPEDEPVFGDI